VARPKNVFVHFFGQKFVARPVFRRNIARRKVFKNVSPVVIYAGTLVTATRVK